MNNNDNDQVLLFRAHQQILKILQKRGFYIPPDVMNWQFDISVSSQDIYSKYYFRKTSNNLIEYVYVGFKLIREGKTKVSLDDINAFIMMANSPLISTTSSTYIDGYSLPETLGYLPQQLPKSFNNFYFNTFYPQATIAHCPRQVILITNDSPHIQFRSFIQDNSFSDGGIDVIQHFLIDELLFDVMEHNSQAQFFVLSDSEKKDFFEEIGGNEGQIPLMLEHDPIAKYLGLKKGTLIRIIQTFENLPNISPLDVEYRIIV